MRTFTLSQVMQKSRERADKVGSGFILDSELIGYINESYSALYDLLVSAYDNDYYMKAAPFVFTTVGQQQMYDLPDDFYKLRGIDLTIGSNEKLTLRQFQWNERNKYQQGTYWSALVGNYGPRYKLIENKIAFYPAPDAGYSLSVWYIPHCPILANSGDKINGVNGWEEFIIIDAAIKMLAKEESDTSELTREKLLIMARIKEMSENRDAGESFRVSDVRSNWNDFYDDVYRY